MDFIDEFNKGITIPTLIMCIISLVLGAIVILRATKQKSSPQFITDSILLLGISSLSYPIFRVIYTLNTIAIAVNEGSAEMSVSLAWKGIGNVLPLITLGLIALLISVICWFVVRRFKTNKVS